jgi:hypothetical protein
MDLLLRLKVIDILVQDSDLRNHQNSICDET